MSFNLGNLVDPIKVEDMLQWNVPTMS